MTDRPIHIQLTTRSFKVNETYDQVVRLLAAASGVTKFVGLTVVVPTGLYPTLINIDHIVEVY